MALIRLNEQHGTRLHRRECRVCREETLHNARGCIHCGTVPKPMTTRSEAFIYGRAKGRPKKAREPGMPAGHERCTRCKDVKPAEEFGADAKQSSGRNAWCKACVREHKRSKRRAA